jgi:hypothetical protein
MKHVFTLIVSGTAEPPPEPEHSYGVFNPDYEPPPGAAIRTETAGGETLVIDERGDAIGACTPVDNHTSAYLALFGVPRPAFVYVPDE